MTPLLSVIMPVFNERATIHTILQRVKAVPLRKEILVVDDGSTDGTREFLLGLTPGEDVKVLLHERNRGKGAAVRTGLAAAVGDFIVIQDADLEYSPEEYPRLLDPLVRGVADAVYGSRFYGCHRVFLVWHYLGNRMLTLTANLLYNTMLSDMETCYKAFRAEVLKGLTLRSDGFDIEPEITAKIFKNRKNRVYEMPITYEGRDYSEGKKITWRDGLAALWALVKYRFTD